MSKCKSASQLVLQTFRIKITATGWACSNNTMASKKGCLPLESFYEYNENEYFHVDGSA